MSTRTDRRTGDGPAARPRETNGRSRTTTERRLRPPVRSTVDPVVVERRERVRSEQRDRRRRNLVVAMVVITVVAAAVGLALSPVFGVRHVRISGQSHVTEARVRDLAEIANGDALLRIDTRSVVDRMETEPWIAGAKVTRSFPTTVRIEVIEEKPLLVLRTEQGSALVSTTGRIIDFQAGGTDATDPGQGTAPFEDTADGLVEVKIDGRIAADSPSADDLPGRVVTPQAMELTRLTRNLPPTVERQVDHVDATDPTAIRIVMRDDSVVLFGPTEDVSAKMAALSAVMVGVDDRCVDRIDVRNPIRVTVTRSENCALVD